MTKVYPNAVVSLTEPPLPVVGVSQSPLVLTIWNKSLLFNCHGFTVFDSAGSLVFRVDNYTAGPKAEIVLMDNTGRSLLTIRRKKLSLLESWLVYDGDTIVNPLFTVTKHVSFLKTKSLAHVTTTGPKTKKVIYGIEGSYGQRCCSIYDVKRQRVSEIKRKEAVRGVKFGGDVFHLIVQPENDPVVAMALVVILDQCSYRKTYIYINSKINRIL